MNKVSHEINETAGSENATQLLEDVSELQAVLSVINRAAGRGLPGGVHGTRAKVVIEEGPFGSVITIRAGALALFTVLSFGPNGNLQSIGAFEDLEPA